MGKAFIGFLIFITSFFVIAKGSVLIGMLILMWGKWCIIMGLISLGDSPKPDIYRRPLSATEHKHMSTAKNREIIKYRKRHRSLNVTVNHNYSNLTKSNASSNPAISEGVVINPASGLAMNGGYGGLDAGGNIYGTDNHNNNF